MYQYAALWQFVTSGFIPAKSHHSPNIRWAHRSIWFLLIHSTCMPFWEDFERRRHTCLKIYYHQITLTLRSHPIELGWCWPWSGALLVRVHHYKRRISVFLLVPFFPSHQLLLWAISKDISFLLLWSSSRSLSLLLLPSALMQRRCTPTPSDSHAVWVLYLLVAGQLQSLVSRFRFNEIIC